MNYFLYHTIGLFFKLLTVSLIIYVIAAIFVKEFSYSIKRKLITIIIFVPLIFISDFAHESVKKDFAINFDKSCSDYHWNIFGNCQEIKSLQKNLLSEFVPTIIPTSHKVIPSLTPIPTKDYTTISLFTNKFIGDWYCKEENVNFSSCDSFTFLKNNELEVSINFECLENSANSYLSTYEILDKETINLYYFSPTIPFEYKFTFEDDNNFLLFTNETKISCQRALVTHDISDSYSESCISWEEAQYHIGESRCVEGIVYSIHDSENGFFINFSDVFSDFYAVSFDEKWNETILNRCVRVFGEISEYNDRPQIVIYSDIYLTYCK